MFGNDCHSLLTPLSLSFFIESSFFIERKIIDDPISNSSLKPQIMAKQKTRQYSLAS